MLRYAVASFLGAILGLVTGYAIYASSARLVGPLTYWLGRTQGESVTWALAGALVGVAAYFLIQKR